MGFLELRCLNGVSKDVRRGAQGDSLQASGKSGLHAHGDGDRVFALESWWGNRASRRAEGLSRSFVGPPGGGFAPRTVGKIRTLGCHTREVLLTSSGQRPEMQLNILLRAGPPQSEVVVVV